MDFKVGLFLGSLFIFLWLISQVGLVTLISGLLILVTSVGGRAMTVIKINKGEW